MKKNLTKISMPFFLRSAFCRSTQNQELVMRSILTYLVISAAVIGVSEITLAQGNGAETITESVDGNIVFNPCTAEGVMLAGKILIVVREDTDATGARHARTSIRGQGVKGVGMSSGNRYEVGGVTPNETIFELGQGATTGTSLTSFHLISHGSGENFVLHLLFHFTISASGEVTSELESMLPVCRG
jgi:hypothetical protein